MDKRVLVVDDDPSIRDMVKAILEAEGFEVVTAPDGKDGVAILDQEPRPVNFRFMVLDMMMPGMHGLDVITRLKLHKHTQALPIIMLTAEKRPQDMMAGYETGADYYITKPFTRQQLLFGVNVILDRQE